MQEDGGRSRPEELKPEAGGSRWWREQVDKYALFSVAIHGQANVKTQDVLYTQRAAQATAADQAAHTRCSACAAKSMDQIRAVESESREVGKSLKIGKNRIKSEKSDLISY